MLPQLITPPLACFDGVGAACCSRMVYFEVLFYTHAQLQQATVADSARGYHISEHVTLATKTVSTEDNTPAEPICTLCICMARSLHNKRGYTQEFNNLPPDEGGRTTDDTPTTTVVVWR